MDKSEYYIKMCESARYLHQYKYDVGFDEGDFVYDGDKVRVVGHDFLSIGISDRHMPRPVYRFAMIEDVNFNVEFDGFEIVHREGEYCIDIISNPVWLPRPDQLFSLVCGSKNKPDKDVISMFSDFVNTPCKYPSSYTYEQYMLLFYMYRVHNKRFYVSSDGTYEWYVENEYTEVKTNGLIEYINEHTTRGPCTCGRCIDAPHNPREQQPIGHTSDVVFFKVSLKNKPDLLVFKKLIKNHNSEFCDIDLFDHKEHNYLEIGAWVGDQGVALTLMGMGELLGVWKLLTPVSLGMSGEFAEKMAGAGMISIRSPKNDN